MRASGQEPAQQPQNPVPLAQPLAPVVGAAEEVNPAAENPQQLGLPPTPVGIPAALAPTEFGPAGALAPLGGRVTKVGVSLGLGETDNVSLAPTDTQAQTIATAGVNFDIRRLGSRVDADLVGDFAYLYYVQHAYDHQLVGRFDGIVDGKLIPDMLTWVVQDSYGEAALNALTPTVPTNLEHVNEFATGPDLMLRPAIDTLVRLGARYAVTDYEISPFDGHRFVETAVLERELSRASKISLNADFEQVKFVNTELNTNFDRRKFYASYDITGARTLISAQLGAAQVNQAGYWETTPLLQLLVTRQLSATMSINVSAGHQYTDASDSFRNLRAGAAGGIVISPTVAISTANYLSNYVAAAWNVDLRRTYASVTFHYERDTYLQQSQFDSRFTNLELRGGRHLSSTLRAELIGTYSRVQYTETDSTQNYVQVGAGAVYQAASNLDVQLHYLHSLARPGPSAPGTEIAPYDENRIFVFVTYRPLM